MKKTQKSFNAKKAFNVLQKGYYDPSHTNLSVQEQGTPEQKSSNFRNSDPVVFDALTPCSADSPCMGVGQYHMQRPGVQRNQSMQISHAPLPIPGFNVNVLDGAQNPL